jgi:hypothetical protein
MTMDLPRIAGVGSEYFLLGFFLFIAFYIIARLLIERHEHTGIKHDGNGNLEEDSEDQNILE